MIIIATEYFWEENDLNLKFDSMEYLSGLNSDFQIDRISMQLLTQNANNII